MSLREHTNKGQTIDLHARSKVHPAVFMLEAMMAKADKGVVMSKADRNVDISDISIVKSLHKAIKDKDLGGPSPKVPKPPTGAGLT